MARKTKPVKRKRHLVVGHLENISGVMLVDHQVVIRDFIKGKNGIYALYKKNRLYYVGLATNLRSRLKAHLRDRHKDKWDTFSIYLTRNNNPIKELESLVLRIVFPKGNKQKGKLPGSRNLKTQLSRELRQSQRELIRSLMGSQSAGTRSTKAKKSGSRKSTRKKRKQSKQGPMAGLFAKRTPLRAVYKKREYRAMALKRGLIKYNGRLYETPTAAAKKICKRNVNGWWFWKVKDRKGEWVRLGSVRKG